MVEVEVKEGITIVPEGTYLAQLEKWGPIKTRKYTDKTTGETKEASYIDAFYKIQKGKFAGKLIRENFSLYISESSELGKLITKFTGATLQAGEKVNLDVLLNTFMQLGVEVEKKQTAKGGEFSVNVIKSHMKPEPVEEA